ncbi:RICIN domain-containing protein [Streptomyces pseudovenezuelae]|uniref:RICIN domain-containing protein n=1 Tax=Streptomyces pseudovenezuelae TaxID=67350 RepID=UPI002E805380|nr:RICIN domain-containing protein [Streptomyces pseudovenezuelae]WUA86010.1 RICIN domain-containing protein [Streptomyces pseudovenezuelae]
MDALGSACSLKGQGSGRCLDITGTSQANGTLAEIWDRRGDADQQFTNTSAGELRVYGGSKCLDVVGAATAKGTAVNIWDCNGQSNQQVRLSTDGTITAVGSGNASTSTAADHRQHQVQIWDCGSAANQKWTRVRPADDAGPLGYLHVPRVPCRQRRPGTGLHPGLTRGGWPPP